MVPLGRHQTVQFGRHRLVPFRQSIDRGRQVVYSSTERERILTEARRRPEHEADGTATCIVISSILEGSSYRSPISMMITPPTATRYPRTFVSCCWPVSS